MTAKVESPIAAGDEKSPVAGRRPFTQLLDELLGWSVGLGGHGDYNRKV